MPATATLEVGQIAPDFRLRGPGGQFVSLSEYRGQKHVVVAFFPLAFSPVCSHQLPDIQKQLARFEALGAVVLGVSVDSHYANEAFARSLGLTFPLLSDFDHAASQAWGMFLPQQRYSARGLFVVDKQGRLPSRDVTPTPAEGPDTTGLIATLERLA